MPSSRRLCFCLCVFVCGHVNSNSCRRILTKFLGGAGCVWLAAATGCISTVLHPGTQFLSGQYTPVFPLPIPVFPPAPSFADVWSERYPVMCSETVGLRTRPVWDQKNRPWSWSWPGLVLCCETRTCHARRHNDLEGHSNFSSTI